MLRILYLTCRPWTRLIFENLIYHIGYHENLASDVINSCLTTNYLKGLTWRSSCPLNEPYKRIPFSIKQYQRFLPRLESRKSIQLLFSSLTIKRSHIIELDVKLKYQNRNFSTHTIKLQTDESIDVKNNMTSIISDT